MTERAATWPTPSILLPTALTTMEHMMTVNGRERPFYWLRRSSSASGRIFPTFSAGPIDDIIPILDKVCERTRRLLLHYGITG